MSFNLERWIRKLLNPKPARVRMAPSFKEWQESERRRQERIKQERDYLKSHLTHNLTEEYDTSKYFKPEYKRSSFQKFEKYFIRNESNNEPESQIDYKPHESNPIQSKTATIKSDTEVIDTHPITVQPYTAVNNKSTINTDETKSSEEIFKEIRALIKNLSNLKLYSNHPTYAVALKENNPELARLLDLKYKAHRREEGKEPQETRYITINGTPVLTKAEQSIADTYTALKINFIYEPIIITKGRGQNWYYTPDFLLTEKHVFHEHLGYWHDLKYKAKNKKKLANYERRNIPHFTTMPEDEFNISQVLKTKLQQVGYFIP